MSIIGEAFIRVRPDTAGFQREAEGNVKQTAKRITAIIGAAYGAKETFDFAKEVVSQAAQVQKSTQAVQQEFGRSSKAVLQFGEDGAHALGIATSTSDAAAAKFGILFHNMGLGQAQSAQMTVGLQKLAGSLSAIRGVDPSGALNSLSLAMLGNMRSLKQLGISFSNQQVVQEAQRLGLLKNVQTQQQAQAQDVKVAIAKAQLTAAEQKYGAGTTQVAQAQLALQAAQAKANTEAAKVSSVLDPAQKAQAIYALATQHLGEYQKQAAAHSGDLSNVTRRLSADWKSAEESIGTALLPSLTKLVTGFDNWLERLQKSGQLQQEVNRLAGILGATFSAVGTGVRAGYEAFQKLSDVLGGSKHAVEALIAAFAVSKIAGFVSTTLSGLTAVGKKAVESSMIAQGASREETATYVAGMGTSEAATLGLATTIKGALISTGIGAIAVAVGFAVEYVVTHWAQVKRVTEQLASAMAGTFGGLWKILQGGFEVLGGAITTYLTAPFRAMLMAVDKASGVLSFFGIHVGNAAKAALNKIDSFTTTWVANGTTLMKQGGSEMGAAWGAAFSTQVAGAMTTTITAAQAQMAGLAGTGGGTVNAEAGMKGAAGLARASTASTLSVRQGQQMFLSVLRKAGWTPDQIAQAQNLINYEDASGKPGDNNSSFGPRQLHVGGQLPAAIAARGPAYAQQWAWSPAGLAYAAQTISQYKNLHGSALANALAARQGSSDIPKEAAAIYGGVIPTGGGDGNGFSLPGLSALTVGTSSTKKPYDASAAKTALELSFAAIKKRAKDLGTDLTASIKKQMESVQAAISTVATAKDAASARQQISKLGSTISDALSRMRTEMALEKTFEGLQKAAARLGGQIAPSIVAQMKKIRAELTTATTPQQVSALDKQMSDLKDRITTQMQEINRRVSLSNSLETLRKQAAALHDDVTPAIVAGMKAVQDAISSVTTKASENKVKQQMASLKTLISQQLAAVKTEISQSKSTFEGAWTQLASGIDTAFDRATQKALAAMKVTVTGAFSSFEFGGDITKTPSEVALANLQDAKAAQDLADQMAADQAKLAEDTAAGSTATAADVAADRKAIQNDAYNNQVAALQKSANVEQAAAAKQLQDAQQAYTDQRSLLKQQLDQRVADLETGMEQGNITVSDGLAQMTALVSDPQYGIDVANSGLVIGGALYQGISDGIAPVFDLLKTLFDEMAKAGLDINGNTATGTSAGSGAGPTIGAATEALTKARTRGGKGAIPFATGGIILAGGLGVDQIPARLSSGEGVIDRDGMRKLIAYVTGGGDTPMLAELRRQTVLLEKGTQVNVAVAAAGNANTAALAARR